MTPIKQKLTNLVTRPAP